jgi:hypothetical protein
LRDARGCIALIAATLLATSGCGGRDSHRPESVWVDKALPIMLTFERLEVLKVTVANDSHVSTANALRDVRVTNRKIAADLRSARELPPAPAGVTELRTDLLTMLLAAQRAFGYYGAGFRTGSQRLVSLGDRVWLSADAASARLQAGIAEVRARSGNKEPDSHLNLLAFSAAVASLAPRLLAASTLHEETLGHLAAKSSSAKERATAARAVTAFSSVLAGARSLTARDAGTRSLRRRYVRFATFFLRSAQAYVVALRVRSDASFARAGRLEDAASRALNAFNHAALRYRSAVVGAAGGS